MNVDACNDLLLLAVKFHAQGRLPEAEQACRIILGAQAGNAAAAHLLAVVLCQSGRLAEGETMLRRLAAGRPNDPDILRHLGDALFEQGKLPEALESARALVALVPGDAVAHLRLGASLQALSMPVEAVTAFETAAALMPGDCSVRSELALAQYDFAAFLHSAGCMAEAEAAYRRAATLLPELADSHLGLGNLLYGQERYAEAAAAFHRALAVRPGWPQALVNAGVATERLPGQEAEAIALFRQAVALRPDYPLAHYNLGVALLRRGDYREGWREYEWRWRGGVPELLARILPQPEWDGGPLDGKTVLLHGDEGFGDTIQFVRFAHHAAAQGGRVLLEVPAALVRLLRGVPGVDGVIARGEPLPPFDCHLSLLSLPGVLDLPESAFATSGAYLRPDPADAARWRQRLAADGTGMRVGLVWSGNPAHRADRHRSLAVECVLARLGHLPIRLYGVQADVRASDAAALAGWPDLVNLGIGLRDFADTAALLPQLDLLISVDTATAHLAGAVGCPVWLMLPFFADWRWQKGRQDTPWYSGMRLFRQSSPGDWDGVLDRVEQALRNEF